VKAALVLRERERERRERVGGGERQERERERKQGRETSVRAKGATNVPCTTNVQARTNERTNERISLFFVPKCFIPLLRPYFHPTSILLGWLHAYHSIILCGPLGLCFFGGVGWVGGWLVGELTKI
jgi:hypothetical protein